jgi:ABC-type phosphate/phosphonate transport system permease subunit
MGFRRTRLCVSLCDLIALFRTVPDLVWALFLVIAVELGPAAGVLAIMIDTIGFAGRVFAEAMEETDKGPREAFAATGAKRLDAIMSAVFARLTGLANRRLQAVTSPP